MPKPTLSFSGHFVLLLPLLLPLCSLGQSLSKFTGSEQPAPNYLSGRNAPAIHLWYGPVQHFGQLGKPQRWVNILGNISQTEQVDSATFSLNGGPQRPLSLGSDLHRLALPGDFNVELAWDELRVGDNQLDITADLKDEISVRESVRLVIEKGNTWPLPYRLDFSQVENLQDVVQVVDGHWQLEADGVRTVQRYYDRVLSMGDTSWTNYETTVELTIHSFTPSEPGPPTYDVTHFGVAMRWRGHHTDGRQPSRKWFPLGAQGEFLLKDKLDSGQWRILFDGGGHKPPKYSDRRNELTLGNPIKIKTQVATLPDGLTRYRFKQWSDGEQEPLDWDLEGFESDDYPSGALCLVPHNSEVTIHEVWVEPLVMPARDFAARPGPGALHYSAPVGGVYGAQGVPFRQDFLTKDRELLALRVNLAPAPGRFVRSLQFKIRTPEGSAQTITIGSDIGDWQDWFKLPENTRLSGISGASGWYVDAIQFHFDNGLRSPRYGGPGGDTSFQLELNRQSAKSIGLIRGFHGTATANGIETLGIIFNPAE